MILRSRVFLPTPEEIRRSPLVDPDFLARLYHLRDGEPVPESTKHGDEIFYLYDVLCYRFADEPNVFVAQNLLWYFDEELPRSGLAPDVFVAFGPPKGHRTSFKEWVQGEARPSVVFEVVSPNDTMSDLVTKRHLYKSLGIRLALVLDGFANNVTGDELRDEISTETVNYSGREIPELGISVEYDDASTLIVRDASGARYPTPLEVRRLAAEATEEKELLRQEAGKAREREAIAREDSVRAQQRAALAKQEAATAQQEARLAEQEIAAAKQEARLAEQEIAAAKQEARLAQQIADRLRARLRDNGLEPGK